jgi:hypothetical protein
MMTIDSAQVLAELGVLQHRILAPTAFLQEVGITQRDKARARIAQTKTTPWGSAWNPWMESTLASRTRKGNTEQGLLFDSGALLASIYYEQDAMSVSIGSDDDIAPYLQDGTKNMDARTFLGWEDSDFASMEVIAMLYLGGEQ